MKANRNELTQLYLQLCYTCQAAQDCETEAKCMACWQERQMAFDHEADVNQTEELLRQYAF